jgi:hypothetical protein
MLFIMVARKDKSDNERDTNDGHSVAVSNSTVHSRDPKFETLTEDRLS